MSFPNYGGNSTEELKKLLHMLSGKLKPNHNKVPVHTLGELSEKTETKSVQKLELSYKASENVECMVMVKKQASFQKVKVKLPYDRPSNGSPRYRPHRNENLWLHKTST
jgi:hypothetical protein